MHALRLGLRPHVAIGDFDSLDARVLERARNEWPDLVVCAHDPHKAHSDLDLALSFTWGLDPDEIALASGGSGRLDHLVISMTLLARPHYAVLPLVGYIGTSVVRGATAATGVELLSEHGNLLTLLAVGRTATLRTSGLRWNLTPETPLRAATSLGLSNELMSGTARLEVQAGSILAIQTHGKPLP